MFQMPRLSLRALAGLLPCLFAFACLAQAPAWEVGAVLDVSTTSRALALGARESGPGLGHSDLMLSGPVGSAWTGQVIMVAHTADGKLETELENAWIQSQLLPLGLQTRAGRFASQIGYLNEQHPHADDFVERPLLYRAMLGQHWVDDGVRLNWTAPSAQYFRLGAEIFSGRQLVKERAADTPTGAVTLNLKTGGDLGDSHSWQFGLSYLHNRREALIEGMDSLDGSHADVHGARLSGKQTWMTDLVWKWAPDGNNRNEQWRLVWEQAWQNRLNRYTDASQRNLATSLSAVWRFAPAWESGLRADWLQGSTTVLATPTTALTRSGRLGETAWMLAYKPTHQQTLRLQLAHQHASGSDALGNPLWGTPASHSLQLQYILGFGAHAAHAY
jgi:hypothetical protein